MRHPACRPLGNGRYRIRTTVSEQELKALILGLTRLSNDFLPEVLGFFDRDHMWELVAKLSEPLSKEALRDCVDARSTDSSAVTNDLGEKILTPDEQDAYLSTRIGGPSDGTPGADVSG